MLLSSSVDCCSSLPVAACQALMAEWLVPFWPSWLDPGALINVDAPGCGTSVVRGPMGH